MDYIELDFSISPKEVFSELLMERLAGIGFNTFEENSSGFKAYISNPQFENHSFIKLLEEFKEDYPVEISYVQTQIPAKNWNAEWESSFSPIVIENKCTVRAHFHSPAATPYDIIITPKMSFGTGHHETTRLMIESMFEMDFRGKEVLDIGCGTGILAILASKLGAAKIVAFDIDEWSVENTLENLQLNSVQNITVFKGTVNDVVEGNYNIILANINRNVILNDIYKYIQLLQPGGILACSGFLITDIEMVTAGAQQLGLHLTAKRINNNWTNLIFTK